MERSKYFGPRAVFSMAFSSDLSARWEQSHGNLAEMNSLETWISENPVIVRNMVKWISRLSSGLDKIILPIVSETKPFRMTSMPGMLLLE